MLRERGRKLKMRCAATDELGTNKIIIIASNLTFVGELPRPLTTFIGFQVLADLGDPWRTFLCVKKLRFFQRSGVVSSVYGPICWEDIEAIYL